MSQEADWLQWHEDRWNLPPSQGGRQEYAPNGPPRGIVPFPLTDAEFDLLLKRFFLADDMLTDVQVNGHEILDTEVAQTLRGKLMEWVEAYGQFPVIADTNAHADNYDALLQPEDYYKWLTVADAKAHMLADIPAAELKDADGNDLPDTFPILVLPPRKYGGFGGVVFYHDDWPDTDNWALYITKAKDFVTDNPQYHDWLIENGGYVSDTDLVYQLHISRQHFLNSTFVTNFILAIIQQNIGILNLNNIIVVNPFPTTPPGGTWPPGTDGPPNSGYDPNTSIPTNSYSYDCQNYPILAETGTNDTELAANLGFAAIAALPLPVLKHVSYDIKQMILDVVTAGDISNPAFLREVEICVDYTYLQRIEVQGFGVTQPAISSKPVSFTIRTTATVDNPSQTYIIAVPPTDVWASGEFKLNVPILDTVLTAKAVTAISTGDNTVIFDDWQNIDTIELNCELLPAIFGPNNNPFENITDSPYLYLGLKRVAGQDQFWRGVGYPVNVDSPCLVGNISPGFLQDSAGWDWKNASGDTQNLFIGVNWDSNVTKILLEIYVPAASAAVWFRPSGSNNQSIMNDWIAVNPQLTIDVNGNYILFSEDTQVDRIAYVWLNVPNGQTNFAIDFTPVPISCWLKIVAYYASGIYVVQDSDHRCSSLTYPPYPLP